MAAVARSRPSGTSGGVARRDDELLGVRAEVAVEPIDQARDAAADREVDAGAGRDDRAGEVPAQAGVVGLVDQPHPVEHPGGHGEVDRVDRGPGDLRPGPGPARARRTGTSMISMAPGPPGVRTTAVRKVRGHVRLLWTYECCSDHSGRGTLQWEVGTLKCVSHS